MIRNCSFLFVVALFALPVQAQEAAPVVETPPVEAQPEPTPVPVVPVVPKRVELVVRQLNDIEFGAFAVEPAGGAITINPAGGRLPTGAVSLMNQGSYGAAEFEIAGQPDEIVTISLPERVNLGKNGGGGDIAITNLTSLPQDTLTLDSQGRGRVKVGGTLRIPGNMQTGPYSGMFDIDVRYLR